MPDEYRAVIAAERAFRNARRRAGELVVCRSGCDDCCRRPFAITSADADRLRRGMAKADSDTATEIRERAREYLDRVCVEFPGEATAGVLTENEEWREWFFGRHTGQACPVLDPIEGCCLLWRHRPVACRLYGPALRVGEERSGPCRLCYEGVPEAKVERLRLDVPLDALSGARGAETLVAYAVARRISSEDGE